MKVRMKVKIGGTLDGVAYPDQGGEWVVPDVVGANLCDRGFAEPVVEEKAEKRPAAKRAEKRG